MAALDAWEALPYPDEEYPAGSDEGEVAGVDLALLDGDVAAVLHIAIYGLMDWTSDWDTTLAHSIPALERVLASLSPTGRAYFGPALPLLLEVQRRRALLSGAGSR